MCFACISDSARKGRLGWESADDNCASPEVLQPFNRIAVFSIANVEADIAYSRFPADFQNPGAGDPCKASFPADQEILTDSHFSTSSISAGETRLNRVNSILSNASILLSVFAVIAAPSLDPPPRPTTDESYATTPPRLRRRDVYMVSPYIFDSRWYERGTVRHLCTGVH